MRFAPLLFDQIAIEREVTKRLRAANDHLLLLSCFQSQPGSQESRSSKRDILAEAPDLLELAKEKFTRQAMEQAWQNLSPERMKILQLEWNIYLLALTVSARAWQAVDIKVDAKNLSFSDSLAVLLLPCEFRDIHRWNEPPQVEKLNAGIAPQPGTAAQLPARSGAKEPNGAFYSNKIIRLTIYFSALHHVEGNQSLSALAV
jgi:hypothetical protein